MPYLITFGKKSEKLTRATDSASDALVLMRVYAANGYSCVSVMDTEENIELSIDQLQARIDQE